MFVKKKILIKKFLVQALFTTLDQYCWLGRIRDILTFNKKQSKFWLLAEILCTKNIDFPGEKHTFLG